MVSKETAKKRGKPAPAELDQSRLRDLALSYVARFATSSAKLEAYLIRKIREKGAVEDLGPDTVRALVDRLVELGYVDDAAYARAKAGGLLRRGYGARRVDQALRGAGIAEDVRDKVRPDEAGARHAALALVQKRRFGPYAVQPPDMAKREKQIAAMIRAGHGFDTARALIEAGSIDEAEEWAMELDDDAFPMD